MQEPSSKVRCCNSYLGGSERPSLEPARPDPGSGRLSPSHELASCWLRSSMPDAAPGPSGSAEGLPGPVHEIRVADTSRPEYQPAPNTDSNIPSNTLPTAGMPRWSHGGGAASQPDSMLNVTGAAPDHGDPDERREEDEEPLWR